MEKNKNREENSFHIGRQSVDLPKPVFFKGYASVVGKKEGEGPLKDCFDMVSQDDYFGMESWEEAESTLQKEAVTLALGKAKVEAEGIDFILSGDLLGQSIASSFGLKTFEIPLIGLYGACSTCGESLGVGAMLVAADYARKVVCVTSSHFASAEKEFRYPLAYGSQRPKSASWTVTGSGAFVLTGKRDEDCKVYISQVTTGVITDYGIKDSLNMGACMAPAAAAVIAGHFQDFDKNPDYYDKIITGDLGSVGQKILFELLQEQGYEIAGKHMDCGIEMYDKNEQGTEAGGSGCGCAASVLAGFIMPKLESGEWKRILFVPTGALLSKTSFNEGKSVPGIAHAVVIESIM